MLIWSRHNRPGPAVAQSPHNNPPRPRLSPLLPPLAPRSPGRPCRPRRALRRRRYHSAPQGGSGRRAGRGKEGEVEEKGGGAGKPRSPAAPATPTELIKSPQRSRRLSGFLPRGRSSARAEADKRAWDSLPSGRKERAQPEKGPARSEAPESGERPLSLPGGCGSGRPGGSRRERGGLLLVFAAPPTATSWCCARSRPGAGLCGGPPLELQAQSSRRGLVYLDAAVLVSESQIWGLTPERD